MKTLTIETISDMLNPVRQDRGCDMSLGIAFKAPDGIVLAVDSRLTLTATHLIPPQLGQTQPQSLVLPATYDNAIKLFKVNGQDFVGIITYGLAALGIPQTPRAAHSYIPEFEDELRNKGMTSRLPIKDFCDELSDFFIRQWNAIMPSNYQGEDMAFLIGGYDDGAPYGRLFEFHIPSRPTPTEQSVNTFGIIWGGQRQFVDRVINGFDDSLPSLAINFLNAPANQEQPLRDYLKNALVARIPFTFLPLQDCVNLSSVLIHITIAIQSWLVDVRGVGGEIDIATITRTKGFEPIHMKSVHED